VKQIDKVIDDVVAKRARESTIDQKRQELMKLNPSALLGDIPVVTIIASALTPKQMETAGGGRWVLADGKSWVGTEYAAMVKQSNVPDPAWPLPSRN
jgi:hypothetical protein